MDARKHALRVHDSGARKLARKLALKSLVANLDIF